MLESLRDLQNLVNEQIENMAQSSSEEDRKFFYGEYLRIKKILDDKMNEYAAGLANFDIL